jgi:hypothetical protein
MTLDLSSVLESMQSDRIANLEAEVARLRKVLVDAPLGYVATGGKGSDWWCVEPPSGTPVPNCSRVRIVVDSGTAGAG